MCALLHIQACVRAMYAYSTVQSGKSQPGRQQSLSGGGGGYVMSDTIVRLVLFFLHTGLFTSVY